MRFQRLKTLIIKSENSEQLLGYLKELDYSPLKLSIFELLDICKISDTLSSGVRGTLWRLLSKESSIINEEIIERYLLDYIDWRVISYRIKLSSRFIEYYKDRLFLTMIGKEQNITLEFIKENKSELNFLLISQNENIDNIEFEKIIRYYKDNEDLKIDWYAISSRPLSNDFIKDFKDKLYMSAILSSMKYDEEFISDSIDYIKKFTDENKERDITFNQRKTEDFVDNYAFNLDKLYSPNKSRDDILTNYKLSESYLNNKGCFDINEIKKYQDVSPEFVKNYKIKE